MPFPAISLMASITRVSGATDHTRLPFASNTGPTAAPVAVCCEIIASAKSTLPAPQGTTVCLVHCGQGNCTPIFDGTPGAPLAIEL